MSQEVRNLLCLASKSHSFLTHEVKSLGVSCKVPQGTGPYELCGMGLLDLHEHMSFYSFRVSFCLSSDEHIDSFANTFPLWKNFFFAWGKRKRPSHYLSWVFHRPPLRRSLSATKNNHGISGQAGKRKNDSLFQELFCLQSQKWMKASNNMWENKASLIIWKVTL